MTPAPNTDSSLPFDEAQWRVFEEDDTQALTRVVALMSIIFAIGIALYAIIAAITAGGV